MVALRKPRPLRPVDLTFARRVAGAIEEPLKRYFRYEVEGLDRVPDGRALLVGNHNGGVLPVDSPIFALAYHRHFDFERPLHFLVHDLLFKLPPKVREAMENLGMVRAHPGAAADLLEGNRNVMVYPGGAYEVYRPFWKRHSVDWNGHMGYVRLAVRTKSPVVPVAGVGAHETLLVLTRGTELAKWLGIPQRFKRISILPIALGAPFGLSIGPLPPHIPLPAQVSLKVCEPMELHTLPEGRALFRRNRHGDPELLARLHAHVAEKMQAGIDDLAQGRIPLLGRLSRLAPQLSLSSLLL